MSKTGAWVLEIQEQMTEEEWHQQNQQNDYSPHDWATSQPEWDATLGRAISLIRQALSEQKGLDTPLWKAFSYAEELAVYALCEQEKPTLKKAYSILGYPEEETETSEIPF